MGVKDFASFKNGAPVPIIGQPFTIQQIMCPVSAKLTCNCGGADTLVEITLSQQANCKSCGRGYNIAFNPTNNKVEVAVAIPKTEVPS